MSTQESPIHSTSPASTCPWRHDELAAPSAPVGPSPSRIFLPLQPAKAMKATPRPASRATAAARRIEEGYHSRDDLCQGRPRRTLHFVECNGGRQRTRDARASRSERAGGLHVQGGCDRSRFGSI